MSTRTEKHQNLVNAIIDQELEAARLAKEAYDAGKTVAGRLKEAARKVFALRMAGKISAAEASKLIRDTFLGMTLLEYAHTLHDLTAMVDTHIAEQIRHIKALGEPIGKVGAIRNTDIKARELQKAGALNSSGAIDGGPSKP